MDRVRIKVKKIIKNTQLKIICIVMLLLLIPSVLLLSIVFHNAEALVLQKTGDLVSINLTAKKDQLLRIIYDTQKLSSIASTNRTLTTALSQPGFVSPTLENGLKIRSAEEWENYLNVQEVLTNYQTIFFNYQAHNLVVGVNGTCYSVLEGVPDEFIFQQNFIEELYQQDWVDDFLESDRESIWYAPYLYNTRGILADAKSGGEEHIVFLRKIRSYTTQKLSGLSVISLYRNNFDKILTAETNSILSLTDMSGNIILHSDKIGMEGLWENFSTDNESSGVKYTEVGGEEYMINYCVIPEAGWRLYYILPRTAVTQEITELWKRTLVIVGVVFLGVMALCIVLVMTATTPVNRLLKLAREVKIGGYVVEEEKSDEIYNLEDAEKIFTRLMTRIEQLIKAVLREQKLEYQLRYQMLRAQINPHFLFNTLNSIKWSATMSGAQNVADMISDLGVLLDASLNRGDDMIPLQDEIKLIRCYAELKSMTMKYPFTVQYDIEEELNDYPILKFTLQPIVENAAIHGVAKMKEGIILVCVYRTEAENVMVEISDNGKGMENQELQELRLRLERPVTEQMNVKGIGLRSIHHMLRMRYGDPYGVLVQSEQGKGTKITIVLPGHPEKYDSIKLEEGREQYAEGSDCR